MEYASNKERTAEEKFIMAQELIDAASNGDCIDESLLNPVHTSIETIGMVRKIQRARETGKQVIDSAEFTL